MSWVLEEVWLQLFVYTSITKRNERASHPKPLRCYWRDYKFSCQFWNVLHYNDFTRKESSCMPTVNWTVYAVCAMQCTAITNPQMFALRLARVNFHSFNKSIKWIFRKRCVVIETYSEEVVRWTTIIKLKTSFTHTQNVWNNLLCFLHTLNSKIGKSSMFAL